MITFEKFDPTGSAYLDELSVTVLHTCPGTDNAEFVYLTTNDELFRCPTCGYQFRVRIRLDVFVYEPDETDGNFRTREAR